MFDFIYKNIHITFSFDFFFVLAVSSLDNSLNSLCALLFCSLHELSHLLLLKIFRTDIKSVSFYGGGIKILSDGVLELEDLKKLAVFSAGVITNLLLSLAFYSLGAYEFFKINLLLACFNMMPCSYLDGGRIACVLIKNEKVCKAICLATTFSLMILIFFASIQGIEKFDLSFIMTFSVILLSELLNG